MTFSRPFAALVLILLALAVSPVTAQEREYINPAHPSDPDTSPFSGAVRVGDTLYISGMLGLVNGEVPSDPAEEARVLLDSIQATLAQADMTMNDLVYVQIFCSDVVHYGAFNAVYREYFSEEFPARAFIGAGDLLFGARFEIQSIAVKK